MYTGITKAQRTDPDIRAADDIMRGCVHCGLCTAECPTYTLLGDERDSPRGRIMLIKDMLEHDKPASTTTVRHIDRCLSCLSCMTACPSGVNYMHLVDMARARIEDTYTRPPAERALRFVLRRVSVRTGWLRASLILGALARPLARFMPKRWARLLAHPAPPLHKLMIPTRADAPRVIPAEGTRKMRVALLAGCAQRVLAPEINAATIRLLTRLGAEIIIARESGCCGSVSQHMGAREEAKAFARANIDSWRSLGVDAIVSNASGCGLMLKDYAFLLRDDAAYAEAARNISALARDVSEVIEELGITGTALRGKTIAYHGACALKHGQGVDATPRALLEALGAKLVIPNEAHMCCGWAGTYNVMQPELSDALKARKLKALSETKPDMVVAGNMGCLMHLRCALNVPALHLVEVLEKK